MNLELIASLSKEAETIATDNAQAIAARHESEVNALLAMFALVSITTWQAIGSRPKLSDHTHYVDNVHTRNVQTFADWRGLRLAGGVDRSEKYTSWSGSYKGESLWYNPGQGFVEITYDGAWSNWQGDSDGWNAKEKILMPLQAVQEWDDLPTKAADALEKALKSYVQGKAVERTKAARERAEKLQAVSTLLK